MRSPLVTRLEPPHGDGPPVLRMPVGQTTIAAPTAAMIYQFHEVALRFSNYQFSLLAKCLLICHDDSFVFLPSVFENFLICLSVLRL